MAYSKFILSVVPIKNISMNWHLLQLFLYSQYRPKYQLMLVISQSGSLCSVGSKTLLGLLTSELVPMDVCTCESIGSHPIFKMNFNVTPILVPKSSNLPCGPVPSVYLTQSLYYTKFLVSHKCQVPRTPRPPLLNYIKV